MKLLPLTSVVLSAGLTLNSSYAQSSTGIFPQPRYEQCGSIIKEIGGKEKELNELLKGAKYKTSPGECRPGILHDFLNNTFQSHAALTATDLGIECWGYQHKEENNGNTTIEEEYKYLPLSVVEYKQIWWARWWDKLSLEYSPIVDKILSEPSDLNMKDFLHMEVMEVRTNDNQSALFFLESVDSAQRAAGLIQDLMVLRKGIYSAERYIQEESVRDKSRQQVSRYFSDIISAKKSKITPGALFYFDKDLLLFLFSSEAEREPLIDKYLFDKTYQLMIDDFADVKVIK